MRNRHLPVIIYVPQEDRERWEAECLEHCDRHDHRVVGIVVGGHERWPHVMSMISDGEARIIVVARAEHLPANRLPRIEIVAEEAPPTPPRRRPRVIER